MLSIVISDAVLQPTLVPHWRLNIFYRTAVNKHTPNDINDDGRLGEGRGQSDYPSTLAHGTQVNETHTR